MKQVALFTTFYEATSGFSLVAVAETQLRSLLDHGYDPVVLVQTNFTESGLWTQEKMDVRKVIPFMHLSEGVEEDFEERVGQIEQALTENLDGVDVCITHDIILQESYKEHNVAMRRYAATHPDLLWLHWIHSCPTPGGAREYPLNCRSTPPPGYIVYPNHTDVSFVHRTYKLFEQEHRVKTCRHSIDPLLVWPYDQLTLDLVRATDFINGEVTAVYPARLDRGKQVEKAIRLMAGVKKAGYDPRLIVVDWQSTGERFQTYMDELEQLAYSLGLKDKIFFTSRVDDRCSQGVPRKVVLELMNLSNLYVHPSRVETYSLTVHEAMLAGCLVVLNHDFPVMQELYGGCAIYMDFSSDRMDKTYTPDEQTFWDDESKRLMAEMKQNRAIMAKTRARREWSPQKQWRELERLLYLQPERGE